MHGNHFYDSLDTIFEKLLSSEITSIFFPYLGKSIVLDLRSNDTDGPVLILTNMANSPQERLRSIKQLRPNFPEVENRTLIPWFRYIDTLKTSGIWDEIINKITTPPVKKTDIDRTFVLNELKKLEKTCLLETVHGSKYSTVWKKHH